MSISNTSIKLLKAAAHGRTDEVRRLIALGARCNEQRGALSHAAGQGHAECVKLLIPVSDPKVYGSEPLRWAAQCGRSQCVKLLISVSDPKANDSVALQFAAVNGHTDCVDLLFEHSDVKAVLSRLNKLGDRTPWMYLQEKIAMKKQHQLLTKETSHLVVKNKKQRKM